MTITGIHKPAGVRVETTDITETLLAGVVSHTVGIDPNVEREYSDGLPFPVRNTINSREDSIEFETLDVDDLLDLVGTIGQCVRVTTEDGFEFYLRKQDKCSVTGAAGSVHTKYAIKNGLMIPTNLSVSHRGNATMSARCEADEDASNAGIAITNNNALPSFASNKKRYTLGQTTLNGVSVTDMRSLQIAFGISIEQESADSAILSQYSNISEIGTTITITGVNPAIVAAAGIPVDGKALAHANTDFYLRRRGDTSGVSFEPDGDADHIKFTAAGLAVATTLSTGDSRSATETTLQIYCEYDGTNNPLVVSTGTAIT